MITTLFLNPYFDANESRRKELEICLENNLDANFDHIELFVEKKDINYIGNFLKSKPSKSAIHITEVKERPAFQTYINKSNEFDAGCLNIVMNSDIYIESEELNNLKSLPWNDRLFCGLSRYDTGPEGSFLLERQDSQDSYIWLSKCPVENADCPIGMAGSDNSILYKFHAAGYKVINPSKSIITHHLHNVKINNYRVGGNGDVIGSHVCPEPYFFAKPDFIENLI